MFDHPLIELLLFEDIPLNRDIFMMDEKWMEAYEQDLLKMFEGKNYEPSGYVAFVAARAVTAEAIELSWYPNIFDRFHELRVTLPRDQFVECTDVWRYDEKPHVFVRGEWIRNLYDRSHSVFALIDVIGMKSKIENGSLSRLKLIHLRKELDKLASNHHDIAFISFADNLLLKSNWSVGRWDSEASYTYNPENILRLIPEIQTICRSVLGSDIYAVVSQGVNEYYDDDLIHVCGNHISLNSLGLTFAQIMALDRAVRRAIQEGIHGPSDIYMDHHFFKSLRFKRGFDKNSRQAYPYLAPMMSGNSYYNSENIYAFLDNLRTVENGD